MSRANTRRVNKAEVQQRRRIVLKRVSRISAGALAIALSLSAMTVLNHTFRVSNWEIEVTGSNPQLEKQVDAAMQSLPSYDFWSTRPSVLRTHLLTSVADLENIEIRRTLTGSLQLQAVARTPVALWQSGAGDIYLVDRQGSPYRKFAADEAADLPLMRIGKSDIRAAATLLHAIQTGQPARYPQISELFAVSSNWKINFNQGQQWMISRNQDIAYAVNKIGTLLAKPRWRSGHWRIDARAESRWFIRPGRQEGVI